MGIRINKRIGYFVAKKDIKKILKPQWLSLIDDIKEKDIDKKSLNHFFQILKNDESFIDGFLIEKWQKMSLNQSEFDLRKLIDLVFNSQEQIKGLFLQTPYHFEYQRHDDLIDYYEKDGTVLSNHLKFLHKPIYPLSGYKLNDRKIFSFFGKTSGEILNKFSTLSKTGIFSGIETQSIFATLKPEIIENIIKTKDFQKQLIKKIHQSQTFIPVIDSEIFAMMKSFDLVLPEIEKDVFDSCCQPVIWTFWR